MNYSNAYSNVKTPEKEHQNSLQLLILIISVILVVSLVLVVLIVSVILIVLVVSVVLIILIVSVVLIVLVVVHILTSYLVYKDSFSHLRQTIRKRKNIKGEKYAFNYKRSFTHNGK